MGLETRAGVITGSFDPKGSYLPSPAQTSEVDLEQDLVGTVRLFDRAQLSLLIPLVETSRDAFGISGFGGGIGDVNLGGRYDFTLAGDSKIAPGVALLAGVTFPTGRPPEQAQAPLATDATGIGAFQLNGGIALEQIYGRHLIVNLTGLLSQRTTRSLEGVTETLGTQLFGIAGAGWVFDGGDALALAGTFTGERDAVLNGAAIPESGRSDTTLSLLGSAPLGSGWRIQGSAYDMLQLPGLGRNLPVGPGVTFSILRSLL